MKKLLSALLFLLGISFGANSQVVLQNDTVTNVPYMCQADSFTVTVSGMHPATHHVLDSITSVYQSNTLLIRIYYSWQAGFTVFSPFQVSKQFPILPFGNHTIYTTRYQNGSLVAHGTSHISVCSGPAGTGELSGNELAVDLYPNPAQDFLNIRIPANTGGFTAKLSDLTGKTILTRKFGNAAPKQLPLESLKAGIYLLTLETDKGKTVRKIIKN